MVVFDIHHKQNHISLFDGERHLLVDFVFKYVVAVHYPAAGVDHRHFHAAPFGFAILAVASGAALIVHDGGAGFGQTVEQR